jgi:hypothetical protein
MNAEGKPLAERQQTDAASVQYNITSPGIPHELPWKLF